MATADLFLHPVRVRIIKAFLGDRALTTNQLAAELRDVPPASLYRQIARLTKAGVLQVVAERRVRGTIERTYTMRLLATQVGPGEIARMTVDEHRRLFMAFVAAQFDDLERYLSSGTPDFVRDGVSYGVAAMWLTDAEYADFLRDIRALLQPRLANAPRKGRRRRLLHSLLLPAPERASSAAEDRGKGARRAGRPGRTTPGR
jgi:DNA-binding transcriptional ArsR family regulator